MSIDRYSRRFYHRPSLSTIALLTLLGAGVAIVVLGTIAAIVEVVQ